MVCNFSPYDVQWSEIMYHLKGIVRSFQPEPYQPSHCILWLGQGREGAYLSC